MRNKKTLFGLGFLIVTLAFFFAVLKFFPVNHYLNYFKHKTLRKIHLEITPLNKYPQPSQVNAERVFIFDFSEKDKFANDSILQLAFNKGFFKDELKTWRKANIYFEEQNYKIKYKFHGAQLYPYMKGQKSFRVKSKKYIKGRKDFKFITREEADYSNIFIANIEHRLDLIAPDPGEIVLSNIEGPITDYWLTSDISKPYLKSKYKLDKYVIYKSWDNWDRFRETAAYEHSSELDKFYQYIDAANLATDTASIKSNRRFRQMKNIIHSNSDFSDLIDKNYIGRFLANVYFFNSLHCIYGDNDKWLYLPEDDKFYPVARNEGSIFPISRSSKNFDLGFFKWTGTSTLDYYKLFLTDPTIKKIRDESLFELVLKKEEILSEFDALYDFYKYVHVGFLKNVHANRRNTITRNLKVIEDYLTTYQVAIAYDTKLNRLDLVTDTRVPLELRIFNSDSSYPINSIKYTYQEGELSSTIEEQYIDLKEQKIAREDIFIINMITKDTVSNSQILFNYF